MAYLKIDKNRYTVDSVYQWDINQELNIYGLSMLAPEIHFTNDAMGGSIVVDCTVDESGVISVNIPNSLLQYKYPILVYVAGFEGDTYKTYHKFSIPVKARKRPGDYTLSLSDNEVYSFTSMERRIADIEDEIKSEGSIVYSYNYDEENTTLVESSGQKSIGEYIPLVSSSLQAVKSLSDKFKTMIDANTKLGDTALSIAKGINSAKVFDTTVDMEAWLSDEANKGKCSVGNNLYIVALEVPDWWIAEVLDEPDSETGFYYKIAQLETQKVDLTTINEDIDTLQEDVETLEGASNEVDERVTDLESKVNYAFPLYNEFKDNYHSGIDMPYDFNGGGAVVLDGEIHILGGNGSTNALNHYKGDGNYANWVKLNNIPYEFYGGEAVVYNNELHILGGNGTNSTLHYKWDKSSDTFIEVSTLPYSFYAGSAVVYNDEIHILGSTHTYCYEMHYKWNGTSWENVSTLPYRFDNGSAVVFNNEIHILGTNNGTMSKNEHYKWNEVDGWVQSQTLPYQAYYCCAFELGGYIHLIGGGNTENTRKYHYKWKEGTTWKKLEDLKNFSTSSSTVIHKGDIYIMGSEITNNTKIIQIIKSGYYMRGRVKKDVIIYYPYLSSACSDNLEVIEDGYRVTEDGEIIIFTDTEVLS